MPLKEELVDLGYPTSELAKEFVAETLQSKLVTPGK
jgi:hypothetical protein